MNQHLDNSLQALSNQVSIALDWAPPVNEHVTFQARIAHQEREHLLRFEIDLSRLTTSELKEFETFLVRHMAGVDDAREVTYAIVELLGISLGQQYPRLNRESRLEQVRELLLADG